jgi:hypothetical protein
MEKVISALAAMLLAARMVQAQGIIYGYFDPVAEYPLVALWTTVDTGHGNIDVEIDCPIIDETKP